MGNQQQPQTTSTTYQLSPEQRQLLDLAMPGVTKFAGSTPQRYQGSTVAGFTDPQTQGQQQALVGAGTQTQLGQAGAGTSLDWLKPGALDVMNNPAVQQQLDANKRSVTTALTESALPAVRDSAERSGNFGSSRQGIAEGVATGKATDALASANASTLNNAYNSNVDAQLKALGLLPQTTQNVNAGAVTTSGVGDVQQAMQQALLNEKVNNFNYDQYAPFLQSQDIISLLNQIPGGTNISTASTPQKNPLTSALGGAATGASLGSAIMPGIGTGIGAGIGGLLSFL